ncbi:MAG: ParB/RepB/Spo0J family partition protein [Firmicutes bacterium]|nr:ParB/RepB/Spo0J family partition protein [Bacillota bacterium]
MRLETIAIDRIRQTAGHVRGLRSLASVAGLSRSIEQVGVLHPVLVQPEGDGYRLIAGYRRLLAAAAAGLTEIPALVLTHDPDACHVQLVENLQREDLNPLEKARAVKAYMDATGLSKRAVANKLGIPRTTITDWLDLLNVDERYQRAVVDNFRGGDSPLTVSHVAEARALAARLGSPGIVKALLDAVLAYHLSKAETRAVARLVRENRDLSIRDAVRAVRPNLDERGAEGPEDADVPLDQRNLNELVQAIDRSAATMRRLAHLSGRFLDEETKAQLLERFRVLHEMTREAMDRLANPPSDDRTARTQSKRRRVKRPG